MHEPAIELPRVSRGARLPFAQHVASARLDVLLFTGATAIVVVHAVVDSFVAPEPGTGPEDHLLRGLGVARAARAWRRWSIRACRAGRARGDRGGARSARARGRGARDRGRSSGRRARRGLDRLPAPPRRPRAARARRSAALALAQARPAPLPPSRRRSRSRRSWRAYGLVLPLAIAILATHRPRAAVEPADLGRPYQEVTIRTSDGLDLAAWYVPSRNGAAVISYPTRQGKLPQARMLVRHGYGVLLLDARGYDGSEGDPNVFGWDGAKDIDAAVAWLAATARRRRGAGSAASASRSAAR